MRRSSSSSMSSVSTVRSPQPQPRVQLTDINNIHPFETDFFEAYDLSSGTDSYSEAQLADVGIQAAAVKAAQDERDHRPLKLVAQLLIEPGDKSPAILPLGDYALRAVNRTERIKTRSRTLRRADSAATQRIRIQPHNDDNMECTLLGNLVEDAVKMAMSRANPTGKTLEIRLGVVDGPREPRRTIEFRSVPAGYQTPTAHSFVSPTVTENTATTTEHQLTPKQEMIEALAAEEQQRREERHSAPLNPPPIHSVAEIWRRASIPRRLRRPMQLRPVAAAGSRPVSRVRRWMSGFFARRASGPQGGGFQQPASLPRRQ